MKDVPDKLYDSIVGDYILHQYNNCNIWSKEWSFATTKNLKMFIISIILEEFTSKLEDVLHMTYLPLFGDTNPIGVELSEDDHT